MCFISGFSGREGKERKGLYVTLVEGFLFHKKYIRLDMKHIQYQGETLPLVLAFGQVLGNAFLIYVCLGGGLIYLNF